MQRNEIISKLAYELTYHKFLLTKDKTQTLFTEVEVPEYISLHLIAKNPSGHVYLTELAEQLNMPISNISRMVTRLKERGFVHWAHTGSGNDGTFVTITDYGAQAVARQDQLLDTYYSQVVERFGKKKLVQLLHELSELEQIMKEVSSEEGDNTHGYETT